MASHFADPTIATELASLPAGSGRGASPKVTRHRPKCVFSSDALLIYDDFLPPADFAAAFAYCNEAEYRGVHAAKVKKAWRLHDGEPLRGPTWFWGPRKPPAERKHLHYPTGTGIDPFIIALRRRRNEYAPVVGAAPADWDVCSVISWIYPVGTGFSVHDDGAYTGSYIFYAHREWKMHWGGHLIVLDRGALASGESDPSVGLDPPWLDHGLDAVHMNDPGIATCVFPKPNRLVLIRGRVPHFVTRVDASAGDRARVTLAGFFVKPDAAG